MAQDSTSALPAETVERLVTFVRDGDSESVTLPDVMALADLMARSFGGIFQSVDSHLHREFHAIAAAINTMKEELGKVQANDIAKSRIPMAGRELDAIVDATETATNAIMESAEEIMSQDVSNGDAYKDAVDQNCMKIFEACSFQDITGQRVSKVVETLHHIEERVNRFSEAAGVADVDGPLSDEEAAREQRKSDNILHGPQLAGDGVNQNEVDALLSGFDAAAAAASGQMPAEAAKKPAKDASQADIDALFD